MPAPELLTLISVNHHQLLDILVLTVHLLIQHTHNTKQANILEVNQLLRGIVLLTQLRDILVHQLKRPEQDTVVHIPLPQHRQVVILQPQDRSRVVMLLHLNMVLPQLQLLTRGNGRGHHLVHSKLITDVDNLELLKK